MNDLLEAALRYANLGYAVFPCVAGGSQPLTERGFLDASTDEETITAWWEKHPKANVGLPTNGIIVVDIDGKGNAWPEDWQHAEDLTRGAMSETPRGGSHHFFRQPEGANWRNTQSAIAPHVDTRANGGYVIVPPSQRAEGGYTWVCELDRAKEGLPEPPQWLRDALNGTKKSVSLSERLEVASDSNKIREGSRNGSLASIAGSMRRIGMGQAEIEAALLKTNETRCVPPLPEKEVRKIAESISRYEPNLVSVALTEGSLSQLFEIDPDEDETDSLDPGPLPNRLLSVPGFIDEVVSYTLKTAPYPERSLAFCGALSLQALLAGRKVKDRSGNRTNLYLLGLANSGSGKDHPRKVNQRIAMACGLEGSIGDSFASGEGIEDRVYSTPSILFQTDEINTLLSQINSTRDMKGESIMQILLKMFSSSGTFYPMRVKSNSEGRTIDQPNLCLFGTAVPKHFYEAMSEKMLTNGFFSRMLVVEAGRRGRGQVSLELPIPESILTAARSWADFRPSGGGNLADAKPNPVTAPLESSAASILEAFQAFCDDEYGKHHDTDNQTGMALWARANEKALKLALIHACSEYGTAPEITEKAATWGCEFSEHHTRRMLYMAASHVSDGEFDMKCKRLLQTVRENDHGSGVPYRLIMRKHRWQTKEHDAIREALVAMGHLVVTSTSSGGRPSTTYYAK